MADAGWARGEQHRPTTVLFVGGNEKQRRYVAEVEASLRSDLPHVRVEWFTPGWTTNWGGVAVQVEARYPLAHAVVVMAFTPTLLARRVRASAGEAGLPWIACTGHGRASVERAIRQAVAVVAAKRRPAEAVGG